MTVIRSLDRKPTGIITADAPLHHDPIETEIQRVRDPQRPDERETMALTVSDGVDLSNKVKTDLMTMINGCEREFQTLKQEALEFIADVAKRQEEIQERITRFTEDCASLKKGIGGVIGKLAERAK